MNAILTREETLCELVDVMLSGGSTNLQNLLGSNVTFSKPKLLHEPPPVEETETEMVIVGVRFTETLDGETLLALTGDEARAIVRILTAGMEIPEEDLLGDMGLSAISEAMNQLMAAFGKALGDHVERVVHIGPPALELVEKGSGRLAFDDEHAGFSFTMTIGDDPLGSLFWVMESDFAAELVGLASSGTSPEPEAAVDRAAGPSDLGALADIEMTAVVELGRARMPVRTLLGMDNGSVIRLGRTVDEPADLYVNGTLAAKGDIVLVDGKLGLRVREVMTVKEGGS